MSSLIRFNGSLNILWTVLPPGTKVAAISEDVKTTRIFLCFLTSTCCSFIISVFSITPDALRNCSLSSSFGWFTVKLSHRKSGWTSEVGFFEIDQCYIYVICFHLLPKFSPSMAIKTMFKIASLISMITIELCKCTWCL